MAFETRLLINGALVAGDMTLDVVNPATGQVFVTVSRASQQQAEAAVKAAKAAQPAWAARPLAERQAALVKFAEKLEANKSELARTLVMEQGKPLPEATAEIEYAVAFVRYLTTVELPVEVLQDDASYRMELHRRPLGVTLGIAPWNFPALIMAYKLAPAVLLGNSFILKAAPTTPVTSLMMGSLICDIFPKGLVNVLVDNNDLGAYLTSHPDIARVSFTGSTETGKKIMASASSTLKRITLELGGNDAGIVLDDVDVATVAPKIFGSAFLNCGQVCIAMKRVYAHSSVYDKLCDELARLADEAIVGDGLDQGSQIGPLHNKAQFEKAKSYLDIARRDGKVIAGGDTVPGGGYFVRPTIVKDIGEDSKLVGEEQFSPILPIMKFDDIDDAVTRANATTYGLGGSVWSSNLERARSVADRINSGTVWVNHHLHFAPNIPFGGAKMSGMGAEFGDEGLKEWSQTTVVSIAK